MPYFSITPARLAQTTSIVTVGALATTYILYVYVEKLGPAFLPMLSDTFVPAPGNYISRVVLSGAALIIGCIGAAPYYTKRQSILPIGRKALLSMSTVASVCLGVVGAVCEDDNTPSCMGNDKVHSSSAIVFFVLYDVYMIALSFKKPILTDATFTQRYIIFFSLFLSLMSKLRWIPPSAYSWLLAPDDPSTSSTYAVTPLSGNASSSRFFKLFAAEEEGEDDYDGSPSKSPVWLACAEYTDVVSIMTWMATYMQIIGSDFEYGLVDQRPDPPPTVTQPPPAISAAKAKKGGKAAQDGKAESLLPANEALSDGAAIETKPPPTPAYPDILCSVSVRTLSECVLVLGIGTVGYTFSLALKNGSIHPATEWPMISDLWVTKPGNMLSRYFVCLGGALCGLALVAHHVAVRPKRTHHPKFLICGTAAGVTGAAALMGVGAINEDEDHTAHITCAVTFFGGMIVWAACDLVSSTGVWVGHSRALGVICAGTLLACKLAQLCHVIKHGTPRRDPEGAFGGTAIIEWVAYVSLLGYFGLANHAAPESKTTKWAFYWVAMANAAK